MQKYLYFFLLLLCTNKIVAQISYGSLSGKITDANTRQTLPNADIYLKENLKGTSSDGKGNFRLERITKGTYTVVISYIGYETVSKKLTINGDEVLNIALTPQAENLKEVVVTSSKKEERELRNSAMTVSVLGSNLFQGTTSSLNDVLNKTVGMTIRSTGGVGSSSRISVRGLEGKRVGIFLDNNPMNQFSDFISLHDVPIDMIERVEIYKGIVPARLGGSAMGGAVNLITKSYPPVYYDVSYEIASFNTHIAQSLFKRNWEKSGLEFGFSANYTYSDNDYEMDLPHHRGLRVKRDHDRHRKLLVGGGLKATKWWFDELSVEAVTVRSDQQIQGIENNIQKAYNETKLNVLVLEMEKKDFFLEGLDFNSDTSYGWLSYQLVDTSAVRYHWDGSTYPPTSIYGGEIGMYGSLAKRKSRTLTNLSNFEYIINENQSINLNSYLSVIHNSPSDPIKEKVIGYRTDFDNSMLSWIGGLSYDISSKNKKWLNSLNVKYYHYQSDSKQAGLLGLGGVKDFNINQNDYGISNAIRYKFTENFMIKGSMAYEARLPSDTELLGDGFLIAPAQELVPERSRNANIGFLYNRTDLTDGKLEVEVNGFYSYVTDMIRFTGGALQSRYENFGKMQSMGIEAEVKADIFPFLYGYANVTYQDLRDKREFEPNTQIPNATKNKRIPNIPYYMSNAGLEFHKENLFGGRGQNTRIMLDSQFVEGYWYDFEVSRFQEKRIPRSLVFNFGIEHSFKGGKILLSARINNLTNQKVISEFNRPLPGRNFGLKIRYRI